MNFEPDSLQRLLLWRLAVGEQEGEFVKNIEAAIPAPRRSQLVREGFVDEQKRKIDGKGRPVLFLELTDKGWAWCQSHLDDAVRSKGKTPKLAAVVLERLLLLMKSYFEDQSQTASFGQFVQQARRAVSTSQSERAIDPDGRPGDLPEQIERICDELSSGRENVRVRLAELRRHLNGRPKSEVDEVLLKMEREGKLSLYRLDDPREIQNDDREAVLLTSTGNERHILYLGGKSS